MSPSIVAVGRVMAIGASTAALLFAGAAVAVAEPPPGCTAADLARISAGVSNATADYLFVHPEANAFFTGLKGQDPDALRTNTENYLNANPQTKTELQAIRQPLTDFKTRCQ